ncbi:two-component sensor histidine kinase [Kocuria dechangensis]|uniref:histidine kinase n=1 Tax=Kocuria dechangensis TaxID=1176249 RepID=A0A917GXV0_9MICC|nr:sensor histidine kinase [Kocuria dechangensis]GGG61192.1 two-component sensor histidine kinase [Kocuria dechangensis]
MDRVLSLLSLNRIRFHELSMRVRVLLTQLPFFVTTVVLLAGLWVVHEPLRQDPQLRTVLALTVALTILCVVVPWDRLPDGWFLVVPVLDFVPLALLREASSSYVTGIGIMAAFPMIWFAASGRLPRAAAPLGFLLTLAMVWVPLLVRPGRPTATELAAPLLIPFVLLGIGFTVQVLSNSMDRQKAELEAKDAELRRLLTATARRERLLDTILDTVDVGVLAIDADGHDVLGNQKQRTMHRVGVPAGAADAAEAELLVFDDDGVTPVPPADRPAARAVAGESFSDRLIHIGVPPRQRVYSVSARTMRDQEGRSEGSVLTFTDVTDLVAALQAKDDFLAGVSHELRTPLTSIRGYTELLAMDDQLPGRAHAGLEVIERNADQLLVLVEDLLGTAGSALELQLQRADVVQVVQQSVAAAELRAAESGVELRVEAPPRLPLVCDSVRIGQVLDNLLSNAIKYSPAGGPVTVRVAPAGDAVQVQVADRGMGMRPQDADKVFSRFFRSQNARMSAIPGLGLGLAVAREIVRLHGGSIRCDSELGEGTVFTVLLPADARAGDLADGAGRARQDA